MNCFSQCSHGRELNIEANSDFVDEDDTFHEDCIWLGAEKHVCFRSYIYVDSELATCGFSTFEELNVHANGRSSEQKEDGDKHEPEPVPSYTEVHTSYEIVESFFDVHVIGKHDILNLEMAPFLLKHKV